MKFGLFDNLFHNWHWNEWGHYHYNATILPMIESKKRVERHTSICSSVKEQDQEEEEGDEEVQKESNTKQQQCNCQSIPHGLKQYPTEFFDHDEQEIKFIRHYVKGICQRILDHIHHSDNILYTEKEEFQSFSHSTFIEHPELHSKLIPSLTTLLDLFEFYLLRCNAEIICIPLTLIYIERMMTNTHDQYRICSKNWKTTICCCVCLASKIYEDCPLENYQFAKICGCSVDKMNDMELTMLEMINFRLYVSKEELDSVFVFLTI